MCLQKSQQVTSFTEKNDSLQAECRTRQIWAHKYIGCLSSPDASAPLGPPAWVDYQRLWLWTSSAFQKRRTECYWQEKSWKKTKGIKYINPNYYRILAIKWKILPAINKNDVSITYLLNSILRNGFRSQNDLLIYVTINTILEFPFRLLRKRCF